VACDDSACCNVRTRTTRPARDPSGPCLGLSVPMRGSTQARCRFTAASANRTQAARSTFPAALVGISSSTMISSGAL
jgi:hypothetical protein